LVYIIKENKKVLGGIMTVDNILTIIKDIIDVCLVWAGVYFILKSIKNNVKFTMLFKGIIIIVIIKLISDLFDLTAIGLLLEYVVMWGPLALVIIFQPEIRSVL
jgi:diadenylate cyclase